MCCCFPNAFQCILLNRCILRKILLSEVLGKAPIGLKATSEWLSSSRIREPGQRTGSRLSLYIIIFSKWKSCNSTGCVHQYGKCSHFFSKNLSLFMPDSGHSRMQIPKYHRTIANKRPEILNLLYSAGYEDSSGLTLDRTTSSIFPC